MSIVATKLFFPFLNTFTNVGTPANIDTTTKMVIIMVYGVDKW